MAELITREVGRRDIHRLEAVATAILNHGCHFRYENGRKILIKRILDDDFPRRDRRSDSPEAEVICQEEGETLCRVRCAENHENTSPEEDIFKHVVVCSEHHGESEDEQERSRAAERKHKVELTREAHLINRAKTGVN